MARRKKRSPFLSGVLIIGGAALAILVGISFFGSRESSAFRTIPALDPRDYLENAGSLRGNTYRISGEVTNALDSSPAIGRLIAVSVGDGQDILPVLVTPEFNKINIQKGQRFDFLIEVDEMGILKTKNLTKS